MNKNVVQFRAGFVNLENSGASNDQLAMTVAAEVMQFGFILTSDAIDNLKAADEKAIIAFHDDVIDWLKKMTGSTRSYRPFWKDFPTEVMEKSEIELWIHQIVHYLSEGTYEPSDWTRERATAFEKSSYTKISAGSEERFEQIFTDLVSVNQSLTPDDLQVVEWFVKTGQRLVFPSAIPFKENLCTLAALGLDVPVKTVTDVLRIAVHMSGGDISLPSVPPAKIKLNAWHIVKSDNPLRHAFKFKKFKRSERKYLLGLLEKTNCDSREAVLKDSRWVRLGEILHPGEYASTFPKAAEMFKLIRNEKVVSWHGEVNKAFGISLEHGLEKLAERPGFYVRQLDALIRKNSVISRKAILDKLVTISSSISNKVLFESLGHFSRRTRSTDRKIMIKGARKVTQLPTLLPLDQKTVDQIEKSLFAALAAKFATLDGLGKVWIDEDLKKIPLPTNMRSLNSSLRPIIRGQRIPIGNQSANTIRAYVHWFDDHGDQDLDLTASFIGNSGYTRIGWNGSHNSELGCYSGDIRRRVGACAEYVDVNVAQALASGYQYVVFDIRNYTGRAMNTVKECVFGCMEREFPEANKIFVPSTLSNAMELRSESANVISIIIDLATREYIFLDIDQSGIPVASANVEKIMDAVAQFTEPPKFSVYNLLELHANSRGTLVDSKEAADLVLESGDFESSYVEILKWMGV
jgi:hypothetical protein